MVDDADVLIAGGGLSGLATAVLLAHHGARPIVVERSLDPWSTTRYHRLNVRTMEILRGAGLESAVRTTGCHPDRLGPMIQVDTLAGAELGRQEHPAESVAPEIGPVAPHRCQDAVLRELLRARALELGVELRAGAELVEARTEDGGVRSRIRDRSGAAVIRSRYLVGADGSDSLVRAAAGIAVDGPGRLGQLFSVFFRADLDAALRGRRFAAVQIKRVGATLLDEAEESPRQAWSLVWSAPPGEQPPAPDSLPGLVRTAVGDDGLAVTIDGVAARPVVVRAAQRWREQRTLLVGDAACTVPMAPGLDGDAIVQDAENLAWKLAAVVQGAAGERLLDTYDAERRPFAERAARHAMAGSGAAQRPPTPPDRLAVELGARYTSAAVIRDPADHGPDVVDPRTAGGTPGVRAPHLDIEVDGRRCSLIELYGRELVLVAGPRAEAWAGAAGTAGAGLPLTVRQVGVDLHETGPSWAAVHGVTDTGAVLVRPDGIVGWRGTGAAPHPDAELGRVLHTLLARDDEAAP